MSLLILKIHFSTLNVGLNYSHFAVKPLVSAFEIRLRIGRIWKDRIVDMANLLRLSSVITLWLFGCERNSSTIWASFCSIGISFHSWFITFYRKVDIFVLVLFFGQNYYIYTIYTIFISLFCCYLLPRLSLNNAPVAFNNKYIDRRVDAIH